MTHVPYLVAGYTITAGAILAYAGWIARRRRALSLEISDRTE